jgi:hypothetical protein
MQIEQVRVEKYSAAKSHASSETEEEFSYALEAYTGHDRSDVFDEGTKTCKTTLAGLVAKH